MPRVARKSLETSFFHIMVQGINKDYIFNTNRDKKVYINALDKYEKECNVEILAYCIMDNHAHMLVYSDRIADMSKFMHFVNGFYAGYYNKINSRSGYVFRDRYKSEPIYKENYLLNCINYIHLNPVKAGIVNKPELYTYSSCSQYMSNKGIAKSKMLYEVLGIDNYREVFENMDNNHYFMDIDVDENEKINCLIEEYQKEKRMKLEDIMKDKKMRKEMINFLHNDGNVEYTVIAKRLNLSTTTIFKIRKD